jgi:uncharacterized membrane protein
VACFLAGLFAVLPLVITVGIVIWVASFVERFLGPETFLGRGLRNLGLRVVGDATGIVAYTVGWLAVLLTIFGLGMLMQLGAKRLFQRLLERSIRHVPLISSVYATSKQMIDLLAKDGADTDIQGMSPVLCHFGDGSSPAVLALLASSDRYTVGNQEYQMVIIPTAPVPFGGALLMMPIQSIQPANISVDGLMSIYVSMGITAPNFLPVTRP